MNSANTVVAMPLSRVDLEREGRRIMEDFAPERLRQPGKTDVERLIDTYLLKKFGWSLDVQSALPPNILAFSDFERKLIVMGADSHERLLQDSPRDRFTGAHEFSHVHLHQDIMTGLMVNFSKSDNHLFRKQRSEIPAYKDPEWQANYLAGCILMPGVHIKNLILTTPNEYELINAVVEIFKVSVQAAEIRIKNVRSLM